MSNASSPPSFVSSDLLAKAQGHMAASLQALAVDAGGPIVALDTSTAVTSVAFVDPERGIHELHWDAPERPCVVLIEGLRQLTLRCGRSIDTIRALVVGLGPGSFTGLRVGLATAKGLSLGAQLPLYGASSLMMAAAEAGPGYVLVLQDARRGELFVGLYQFGKGGEAQVLMADCALMPEALHAVVAHICSAQQFAPGALKIVGHQKEFWAETFGATAHQTQVRALWGVLACASDIKAQRSTDAVALIPQYLRLSEPERQHLARQAHASGMSF